MSWIAAINAWTAVALDWACLSRILYQQDDICVLFKAFTYEIKPLANGRRDGQPSSAGHEGRRPG